VHPYQGAQQSVPIRVTELYNIHYNKSSNFFNSFLAQGIVGVHYRKQAAALRLASGRFK
jgi:hypothetical protein